MPSGPETQVQTAVPKLCHLESVDIGATDAPYCAVVFILINPIMGGVMEICITLFIFMKKMIDHLEFVSRAFFT